MNDMDNNIWEQQPKETIQGYEAFKIYMELGSKRSLKLVANKLGKGIDGISAFSCKYQWVRRVSEYDRYISHIEFQERETMVRETLKRHADTSILFEQKVIEVLNQLNIKSFREMSPLQLVKMFEIAVSMERNALGIPLVVEEVRLNQAQDKLNIEKQSIKNKNGGALTESSGFLEGINNMGKVIWGSKEKPSK